MATVTLQVQLAGPTDNGGTCRVHYSIVSSDGVVPEIFVVKYQPAPYVGADPVLLWQHVAYADELDTVPVFVENAKKATFIRKADAIVSYTSLELAREAINSIKSQIQRLMNELETLSEYSETQTYIITSKL